MLYFSHFDLAHAAPSVTSVTGGWTWFNDRRILSVGNGYAVGAITGAGDLMAYDLLGGSDNLHGSTFDVDDHGNPSFLKRSSDGRIIAFASAHNGANLYTYLSADPEDPTTFGAGADLDSQLGRSAYSYTSPVQLTGESNDPIYLFFRALGPSTNRHLYYSTSADQGATWASATLLFGNNGDSGNYSPYVKVVANGDDRIDIFLTDGHPEFTSTNSIYHCYYQGGAFHKTDGTTVSLPIAPSTDLSKVYDGTTTRAWIWDCAIDGSGNPVCVYATFPSTTDHRYRRANWNGASWDDTQICTAGGYLYTGQPYYSGGVAIDPDNVNQVFASREVNGEHQLWRYVYSGSWTGEQITQGQRSIRPYVARGAVAEPRLFYMAGNYHSYTVFDTTIELMDSDAAGVTLPTDAQHASTCLIVNFHGPAGATSITDYSPDARTATFRNNAVISAEQSRWGVSAAKFDGSGDAVTFANHADFQFGTSDFTIELAGVKLNDWSPADDEFLIGLWRTDNNQRSWAVRVSSAGALELLGTTDGSTIETLLTYTVSGFANGESHDIAVRRVSGVFTLWVDGVQVNSNTVAYTFHAGTGLLNIGNIQSGASTWATTSCMTGYLSGVRITNASRSIAALTAAFPLS